MNNDKIVDNSENFFQDHNLWEEKSSTDKEVDKKYISCIIYVTLKYFSDKDLLLLMKKVAHFRLIFLQRQTIQTK